MRVTGILVSTCLLLFVCRFNLIRVESELYVLMVRHVVIVALAFALHDFLPFAHIRDRCLSTEYVSIGILTILILLVEGRGGHGMQ